MSDRDLETSAERPRAVLIAGPTASGKSALALALAERVGGTVVNADSMQVYRDLAILTARPTAAETARVPHQLYGEVDAAEAYSTGRWVIDAGAAIAAIEKAGRLPVLVGGTGLYFKALVEGLSDIPPVPDAVRRRVRDAAEGVATGALHARLAAVDAETAAALRPTDRQRVLRALEVLEATGRPLAHWQRAPRRPMLPAPRTVRLFLTPDRAALRARIDARFDAMLAAGALDEVAGLVARRLDPTLPAMRAHGVPALAAHLAGRMDLAAAAAAGKADTRAYARRQMTWFRHQMAGWTAVEGPVALDTALRLLGA